MASILNVDQINNAAGTSAITIDSNGNALMPGHVVQVVNTVYSTLFTHNNTSNVYSSNITGLATTITPTSTSNKILIVGSVMFATGHSDYGALANIRCLRNSTQIGTDYFFAASAGYDSSDSASASGCGTCSYLDSPATTSAITYNFQIRQQISGGANIPAYINGKQGGVHRGQSMITLMEIAQ